MTEVVQYQHQPVTALAIRDDQVMFDEYQRKALAHMGVENATNADLAIFMHHCKRTGLDPFARQIHMIGRNSKNLRTDQWETKFTIQTGIDGYRLIARRAAGREGYGYEDPAWCGPDGAWTSVWLDDTTPPVAARVVVVRNGQRFPAVARYKAYVQTKRNGQPNSIWTQRDAEQLEKCAEALALRKAFPQDLSGIYTDDEMRAQDVTVTPLAAHQEARPTAADFLPQNDGGADAPDAPESPTGAASVENSTSAPPSPDPMQGGEDFPAAQNRIAAMFAEFGRAGFTTDARSAEGRQARLDYCTNVVGRQVESSKDLSAGEVERVINALKADASEGGGE